MALYLWLKFGASHQVQFITVPFEGVVAEILEKIENSQMGVVLKRIQESQTRPGSVESDVKFHLLIAQATGNRYFVDILTHLGTTIIPRARLNSAQLSHDEPSAYLQRVNREHEDIFHAIERRDPEGARAAMRTHLSNSRERLRKAQEESTGS